MELLPITAVRINERSRDAHEKIAMGLSSIYENKVCLSDILTIMEERIESKTTGRNGMNCWQIFVLGMFRLGLNISYDRLLGYVHNCHLTRTLLGIESSGFTQKRIVFGYQTILDNVRLFTPDMLQRINDRIAAYAMKDIFKMKPGSAKCLSPVKFEAQTHLEQLESEAPELLEQLVLVEINHLYNKDIDATRHISDSPQELKTDSFVVENNTHFPTDYNLVYDGIRKSLDTISQIVKKHPCLKGWRKLEDWRRRIKNMSREIGQVSSKGGKNKEIRLKCVVEKYIEVCTMLLEKIMDSVDEIKKVSTLSEQNELAKFVFVTIQLIDLLEKRIMKGDKILHSEKLFSIFEQYTEWINKGKMRPNVELGKMLCITTNQHHLIVDYRIMDHTTDSEVFIGVAADLLKKFICIKSWSFDKGFWNPNNYELASLEIDKLVLPKKGKSNQAEAERENNKEFKKLRRKHSAVESNINELEHRGLDRCPDRGRDAFERYIGLAVCAYNLHKIGNQIMVEKRKAQEKAKKAS